MSVRQCWIVSGKTGEFGDAQSWMVRAFTRREEAEAFAAVGNDWLKERGLHHGLHYPGEPWLTEDKAVRRACTAWGDDGKVRPEWDPQLEADRLTGSEYVVLGPVPLVDGEGPSC